MRFGWPTGVTHQADRMRTLWTWSSVAALIVGIIVWGLIFWCCGRYRKKDDVLPKQMKYHLPIEIAYTIAPFVIIAGLFYYTAVTENYVDKLSAHPDVTVQVDAFKWNWQFEYLESKGAQTSYGQGDPAADEPLSTVGSDDEIPVLVIPVDRRIRIIEHSYDVIHSFWVPQFLFKRDVIPFDTETTTHDNRFEFDPISRGIFVGRCAELCGTYHSQMNFEVRIVTAQQFADYLSQLKSIGSTNPARQQLALERANIPGGGRATTTIPFDTSRTQNSATAQGS